MKEDIVQTPCPIWLIIGPDKYSLAYKHDTLICIIRYFIVKIVPVQSQN